MVLAHFIFPPRHLCRSTENATPGLRWSEADGAAQCWNAAFVNTETPGSVDNDVFQKNGEKYQ